MSKNLLRHYMLCLIVSRFNQVVLIVSREKTVNIISLVVLDTECTENIIV